MRQNVEDVACCRYSESLAEDRSSWKTASNQSGEWLLEREMVKQLCSCFVVGVGSTVNKIVIKKILNS